jgi:hypothetical protein
MGAGAHDEVATAGEDVLMPRVAPLLVAVLVSCLLVGCGSDETARPSLTPENIAAAAMKTADFESYRTSFSSKMEVGGQSIETTGDGAFAAKGKKGRMAFKVSAQGVSADVDAVFAWPVFYMRFPPEFGAKLPVGKDWVSMNMQKLGESQGIDFRHLMQTNQSDPGQALVYLRRLADLETVGEEEVRGVDTTHFHGVADLRAVADQFPETRALIERIIEQTKVTRIPADVWVSSDGLVRRLRYQYDNMQLTPGVSGDMTIEMELYDFGVHVNVETPPAHQVVDLQDLLTEGTS